MSASGSSPRTWMRSAARIAATTQALLATREAEVERLPGRWAAGETPTRAEAARWVAGQAARLGYIDDLDHARHTPCPVSGGELAEFARLIRQVGVQPGRCLRLGPAAADRHPARPRPGGPARELADLQASVRSLDGAVQDWDRAAGCGRDGLQALAARCHAEMEWAAKTAGTWLGHVRDQADDPLLARDWQSFGAQLSRDRQDALRLRGVLTAHRVVIPDVIEPSFVDGLRQARDRLAQGGKLGMFAGPAKRAVQECEVDGRLPSTAEDIDLCLQAVTLEDLRRRMLTSWRNQLARVGGPDLGAAVPEDVLGRAPGGPGPGAQLAADLGAAAR